MFCRPGWDVSLFAFLIYIFMKTFPFQLEVFLFRFSDFGTMLEIRGIQYFEDGQSVLDTVGGRRFKVLERDVRDGYQTANVEFLEDAIPADSDVEELQVNNKLEKWIGIR